MTPAPAEVAVVIVREDREIDRVVVFSNGLLASIWVERMISIWEGRGVADRFDASTFVRVEVDEPIATLLASEAL